MVGGENVEQGGDEGQHLIPTDPAGLLDSLSCEIRYAIRSENSREDTPRPHEVSLVNRVVIMSNQCSGCREETKDTRERTPLSRQLLGGMEGERPAADYIM